MLGSRNPCNFSYEDCVRVLLHLNFTEAPNSGTSHRKFVRREDGKPQVTIGLLKPSAGSVGKEYVKEMLRELRSNGLTPPEAEP